MLSSIVVSRLIPTVSLGDYSCGFYRNKHTDQALRWLKVFGKNGCGKEN